MQPEISEIDRIIQLALSEDLGRGDITSAITVPPEVNTEFVIRAREEMVVCGINVALRVFAIISDDINASSEFKDGDEIKAGDNIITGSGNAQAILASERVALNLLRQMSGVATLTRKFVNEVKGTNAKILDTRKTIPGLRSIQKYAVKVGGGYNHRFGLDDGILIKDNHISVSGGIKGALDKAKEFAPSLTRIEVECDNLDQVAEALEGKADVILLDNMSIADLKKAVAIVDGRIPLEASGNVNLKTVGEIAKTGVNFISAGALTNSPPNVDIGLDIDL